MPVFPAASMTAGASVLAPVTVKLLPSERLKLWSMITVSYQETSKKPSPVQLSASMRSFTPVVSVTLISWVRALHAAASAPDVVRNRNRNKSATPAIPATSAGRWSLMLVQLTLHEIFSWRIFPVIFVL